MKKDEPRVTQLCLEPFAVNDKHEYQCPSFAAILLFDIIQNYDAEKGYETFW